MKHSCALILFVTVLTIAVAQVPLPKAGVKTGSAKWVRISANFVVNSAEEVLSIIDQAKAAGANGVLLSDTKTRTFWFRSPGQKWFDRIEAVRAGIKSRGMNFVLTGVGIGYCNGPQARDPNLAAGYPMKAVPMLVSRRGVLNPVETASIPNGGFENANNNVPTGWGFQDGPGDTTFIDSREARSGAKSLRFDVKPGKLSRLFGTFTVKPFQQYTISVWVKMQSLTVDNLLVLVRDAANTDRSLTNQAMSTARAGGTRDYFSSTNSRTLGWTQMKLPFNSQSAKSISLVLGAYGGRSGSVWWDDVVINSTPLLNLIRRKLLTFKLSTRSGRRLREKTDFNGVRDPKLGQAGFQGNYDTYHDVPPIVMQRSAGVKEGDTVFLSGYHAMITARGQAGCSWLDRKLFSTVRRTYVEMNKKFAPDGFLVAHDEIRTGGWEPAEVAKGTSGKALAAYVKKEINMIRRVTKNKPLFIWSDMFDPGHNAGANYYQVRSTLAGSWKGLDRQKISIVNWEDRDLKQNGKASVAFFDQKGFTQVIAGYYDFDVRENHQDWQKAINGRKTAGSMYTTWRNPGDFSKLEAFGDLWGW